MRKTYRILYLLETEIHCYIQLPELWHFVLSYIASGDIAASLHYHRHHLDRLMCHILQITCHMVVFQRLHCWFPILWRPLYSSMFGLYISVSMQLRTSFKVTQSELFFPECPTWMIDAVWKQEVSVLVLSLHINIHTLLYMFFKQCIFKCSLLYLHLEKHVLCAYFFCLVSRETLKNVHSCLHFCVTLVKRLISLLCFNPHLTP